MGDYAFLVGWDSTAGKIAPPLLEAKNYVPLFWMAMFDPDDIRDAAVDGAALVRPPNAGETFEDTTFAFCEGTVALERLKQRIKLLGKATNETLAAKFTKFAQVYAKQPVLLRLSGLIETPEHVEKLRATLAAVADPTTSAERLRVLGGLGHGWESQPHAENLLVGSGTELTSAERGLAKQRRVTPKVSRAARERTDGWRAAVGAVASEERKRYAASAGFVQGDVIEHAKFGAGVVMRMLDKTKIEVQFEHQMNVLVHKGT